VALVCARCGVKQGMMAVLSADIGATTYYCEDCKQKIAQKNAADKVQRIEKLKDEASKVIVTTTMNVDRYYVAKYVGIESVEFVIGTGAFSEISTSIADFFGARSSAFEKKLRAAKAHAIEALKFLAAEQGANAVIGIDLDYTEFTGNRIALIINGTLVQLAPIPARRPNSE
jgi:uncharacterized protein YbjQ (UPF0145 family)